MNVGQCIRLINGCIIIKYLEYVLFHIYSHLLLSNFTFIFDESFIFVFVIMFC